MDHTYLAISGSLSEGRRMASWLADFVHSMQAAILEAREHDYQFASLVLFLVGRCQSQFRFWAYR